MIGTEENAFPEALPERYHPLACLAWKEEEETYCCLEKETGRRVLVKIAKDDLANERLRREKEIQEIVFASDDAVAKRFPRFIAYISPEDNAGHAVLVRSYISGYSLEAVVGNEQDKPGLRRETALKYMAEVLEQLCFLHRLQPPVIHRDIKPQNVIVDNEDHCHLIDLDIARVQKDSTDADTVIIGTRLTSPPEQYGFRPTDNRSDVYSAGVLMLYCLTGEYEEKAIGLLPTDLRRIVQKATRFDPKDRYQRAEAFLADVQKARKGVPYRRIAGILLALLLVALGMMIGVFIGRNSVAPPGKPEAFATGTAGSVSPKRITEAMFDGDTDLYQRFQRGDYTECSALILQDGLHFIRYNVFCEKYANKGDPGRVNLSAQELEACLNAIRSTGWWGCGMNLMIYGRNVESLEPFRMRYPNCPMCLEFHYCALPADPEPLSAFCPAAWEFCCSNTVVAWDSIDFLRRATGLNLLDLVFNGVKDVDLSALEALSDLRILRLSNTAVGEEAMQAIGRMKNLKILSLENCGLTDLSGLAGLSKLQEVYLRKNEITDFSPLEELPELRTIVCDNPSVSGS